MLHHLVNNVERLLELLSRQILRCLDEVLSDVGAFRMETTSPRVYVVIEGGAGTGRRGYSVLGESAQQENHHECSQSRVPAVQ